MQVSRLIMGMPVTINIADKQASKKLFDKVFDYFRQIDGIFSPYKSESEVTKINKGLVKASEYSKEMTEVVLLAEDTKQKTEGYFDVWRKGKFDPSGLVKGWAIENAAGLVRRSGVENFFIEAGGDIQAAGLNEHGKPWTVGIRNPFDLKQIVKVLYIQDRGVATSGSYIRGQHIYDPHSDKTLDEIISLTVIGPNIYEADRYATAAFAMGRFGINFIENLPGFEAYQIDRLGQATFTSGFKRFTDYETN